MPIAEIIMSIHPQIIEKNGNKEFVVLPYEEFLAIREELEDFQDLKDLRNEKSQAAGEPVRPLDTILKELGT